MNFRSAFPYIGIYIPKSHNATISKERCSGIVRAVLLESGKYRETRSESVPFAAVNVSSRGGHNVRGHPWSDELGSVEQQPRRSRQNAELYALRAAP